MFIATKDSKIIAIHNVDWECRRAAKGLDKPSYWKWLETVTTDGVSDYSGETDYTMVETDAPLSYQDDKGLTISFHESGHITSTVEDGISYHLKWDSSKKEFIKDDDSRDAWLLAEEWKLIREERDRLLTNSDWTQGGDTPLTSAKKTAWATYRTKLRDIPKDQKDKTTYASITWPSKPS
tara:strand:- start:67 stop:606 length:540 start_codon:yes stop_codon:yes gene_type:complete